MNIKCPPNLVNKLKRVEYLTGGKGAFVYQASVNMICWVGGSESGYCPIQTWIRIGLVVINK